MDQRAYLDFYEKLGSELVSRDLGNLEEFFRTREALYMSLGIVPSFVKGRTVLEFGPGTGHNSLYTAHLAPGEFVLVDGGQDILDAAQKRLSVVQKESTKFKYVYSLFEDYLPNRTYDLVIAEACIPMQKDPQALLKHVGKHVKKGGVLIITTISAVSYLSEILRRLGRDVLIQADADPEDQLKTLRPIYTCHLQSLAGLGRSVDHWLLDNIVQPFDTEKLLTFPDALEALAAQFEYLGSSPRFMSDWRWHKTMVDATPGFNQASLESYYLQNMNLIDHQVEGITHEAQIGVQLEHICSAIWDQMVGIENRRITNWTDVWSLLADVLGIVEEHSPKTFQALSEAITWLRDGAGDRELSKFSRWWGRGQQYISFIRRTD